MRMKIMEAVATAGVFTKVPATMSPKIATTRIRDTQQKIRNIWRPAKPMSRSITYPMERPPCLTERNREAKS